MWIEVIGYVGAVLCVISYAVSTMIPLRILSLLSAVAFVVYGVLTNSLPVVITELILIPLNAYRLYEMLRLVRKVEAASTSDLSMDWLAPFGSEREAAAGDAVFAAGDDARDMYLIKAGRFRLVESGLELGPGDIVGELGMVSPDNRRTQGLKCVEDGLLLRVSYNDLRQLYFQNPQFGFYFLRLISARLFENLESAKAAATVRA